MAHIRKRHDVDFNEAVAGAVGITTLAHNRNDVADLSAL